MLALGGLVGLIDQGCQIGFFFLTALAMKKCIWPFCKIWPFFGHFFGLLL